MRTILRVHISTITGTKNNPKFIKKKTNENHILWVFIAVWISTNKTKKERIFAPFILKFHPQWHEVSIHAVGNSWRMSLQFMQSKIAIHCAKRAWLVFKFYEFNAGFVEQLDREVIGVGVLVDDALDATVDDDTCADGAGLVSDVHCCALNRHTMFWCLYNGIMHNDHAMRSTI